MPDYYSTGYWRQRENKESGAVVREVVIPAVQIDRDDWEKIKYILKELSYYSKIYGKNTALIEGNLIVPIAEECEILNNKYGGKI
jgi:hypothetical protein